MITNAADVEDGTILQADLCIVGAGPAGITIARELAGTSLQVVLLESGSTEPDEQTTSLYQGEYLAEPFLNVLSGLPVPMEQIRLRYLGGTSGHWAGYCRPIDPIAFEPRPWVPASAWPFPRSELDPYYERAAQVLYLSKGTADPAAFADEDLGATLPGGDLLESRVIQITFPMRFGSAYRSDLEQAENVQLVLDANVTRLAARAPNADHIDQADVATFAGGSFVVQARAFVVATGGIESARLLLASNDVNPAGVGNERDLVGRYFCEHLVLPAGFALLTEPAEALDFYVQQRVPAPAEDREGLVRGALVTAAQQQAEGQLLDWEAQLVPGPFPQDAPGQPDGPRAADVDPLVQQVDGLPASSITFVQVTGEQIPRPENQVVLSETLDALGQRRADLRWTVAPEERASMVASLQVMARQLAGAGLGRVQYVPGGIGFNPEPSDDPQGAARYGVDPALQDDATFPVGVGYHHMGTLRMAADASQGVVDADAKVHSVDNLFVAGSSVFPTTGANTPTWTIVALALRLSDHLQGQVLT